jgi:ankyrin repeat protein
MQTNNSLIRNIMIITTIVMLMYGCAPTGTRAGKTIKADKVTKQAPLPAGRSSATAQELDWNAVLSALAGGRLDELAKFYEHDAKVLNMRDAKGGPVANVAAKLGSLEELRFIAAKAPETLGSVSNSGESPAHNAASVGCAECLELLGQTVPVSLSKPQSAGLTPAHFAAANDFPDSLRVLSKFAGASLMAQDANGNTPAHFAAEYDARSSLVALRKYLDSPSLRIKNQQRETPLDVARRKGHEVCTKILLGEDPTAAELGIPENSNWLPVVTTPAAARAFSRWTSTLRPVAEVGGLSSGTSVTTQLPNAYWDDFPDNPRRLMFFTNANSPLKDLSDLVPMAKSGEFAFWDSAITSHMYFLLSKAGLVAGSERPGYKLWLTGDATFSKKFTEETPLKLLVTYSVYEEQILKAGGVPIKLVPTAK